MAKKTQRIIFGLECTKCKNLNYTTTKNKINNQEKIELNKFCKHCREHTLHKETKVK